MIKRESVQEVRATSPRSMAAIRRDIAADWEGILQRSGVFPLPGLPASPTLLGTGTKTEHGRGAGVETRVVYLAPADEAFQGDRHRTLCAWATQCAIVCLGNKAGLLAESLDTNGEKRNARAWKTALLFGARGLFRELIVAESLAHEKTAVAAGYVAAVRVDGSSDTGEGAVLAATLYTLGSSIRCYDYTKGKGRALKAAAGGYTPNYSVVFSRSGENESECAEVLAAGGNVAAVFDTDPRDADSHLPATHNGVPVYDGDRAHGDARFLDPVRGHYIGLRFKQAKGRDAAIVDAGSFVIGAR